MLSPKEVNTVMGGKPFGFRTMGMQRRKVYAQRWR